MIDIEKFNKAIIALFEYFSTFRFNQYNAEKLACFYLQFAVYREEFVKNKYGDANKLMEEIKNFVNMLKEYNDLADDDHKKLISSITKIIVRGACDCPVFYKKHKMMLQKWIKNKTPKSVVVKEIASWLNMNEDEAVVETMKYLTFDNKHLVDFIAKIYGHKEHFNEMINFLYKNALTNFISYYVEHRNFYCGSTRYKEKIKIGSQIEISIKDDFIDIDIIFKKCEFSQLEPLIKKILNAITSVDKHAIKTLLKKQKRERQIIKPGGEPFLRKEKKEKLLKILKDCKFSCLELPPIEVVFEHNEKIENILKTVAAFIKAEEAAHLAIEEISSVYQKQANKLSELNSALFLGDIEETFVYVAAAQCAENKSQWEKFLGCKWTKLEGKDLDKLLAKIV